MKKNIGKFIFEGLLIILSVLFALFINRMAENAKTEKKKNIAIERITKELYRNEAILKTFKEEHKLVLDRISSIIYNPQDTIKEKLFKYDYFNLGIPTDNKPLVNAILTNTAWEAAKSTEIISEFNYDLVLKLTNVYEMQNILMSRTLNNIIEFYFDIESHDMENFNPIVFQFNLRIQELVGQEILMEQFYSEALNELKK